MEEELQENTEGGPAEVVEATPEAPEEIPADGTSDEATLPEDDEDAEVVETEGAPSGEELA